MVNKRLAKQLLEMGRADIDSQNNPDRRREVIKSNNKEIREIMDKHGWPTISMVDKKASHAAWLVVQHANIVGDQKLQEKALILMKLLIDKNEVLTQDLAHLEDRVLLNQGKKQLYGSYFKINENGEHVPLPIKDLDNLEKRRKKMGLLPLKEYKKYLKAYSENKK